MKASEVVFRGDEPVRGDQTNQEFEGCQLCLVEIEGEEELSRACITPVAEGMVIHTDTPQLQEKRQDNLAKLLEKHPHTCLICPQREGCDLIRCSSNVPENERCCAKFTHCELREVAEYIGIREDIPKYIYRDLPVVKDEPFFDYDYNLCIGCLRCVRMCHDVKGVGALSFVYQNNQVVVGSLAPSLKESGCKFCGACVEVCPTGALLDKPFKAGREASLVPCKANCPAGVDIPRYVRLIAEGKFAEAVAVIREKVPFPGVLGRVCPHPCEGECRRNELNQPIAIRMLKRFASENDSGAWRAKSKIASPSGKKVAIIGSGPAGLTAAYYLAELGHSITVFEASPQPGGMMRMGIPEYRLPRKVLDLEIDGIRQLGVEIKLNTKVTSIDELLADFQAVFIAIGAHCGVKLGIDGEDSPKVIDGVSLLREVNLGKPIELGEKVMVVGGGNVAIDASRTALRLGAREVTIAYRRTRAEMPASEEEIIEAEQEGVKIHYLAAPIRILTKNNHLQIECLRMKLGEPDESGRARPIPIEGSKFIIEADRVIPAIGQTPDFPSQWELETDRGNVIKVNPNTLATNKDRVFAGGDVANGPATVIEAIAMGRKAAISIDRYLGGEGNIDEELVEPESPALYIGRDERFADRSRVEMPCLTIEERVKSFDEVELGLDSAKAVQEAKRCLRCDLRLLIAPPPLPPKKWLKFDAETVATLPEVEGVCQLLDEDKNIIYIKGAMNLRGELTEQLETNDKAAYFLYEEEPMYTSRESELLQQFLQRYGKLPDQNVGFGLDEDLFDEL
jgi:NADPH-dependent glutamate synthase beta subunit-like oxidoreductase